MRDKNSQLKISDFICICPKFFVPLHSIWVHNRLRTSKGTMAKKNDIAKTETPAIKPVEQIESLIITVRGKQVILDRDLARLYGVETRVLNQAVQRNIERFPEDFMFQLSKEEAEFSKSQFVTLNEEDTNLRSQNATSNDESPRSQFVTL